MNEKENQLRDWKKWWWLSVLCRSIWLEILLEIVWVCTTNLFHNENRKWTITFLVCSGCSMVMKKYMEEIYLFGIALGQRRSIICYVSVWEIVLEIFTRRFKIQLSYETNNHIPLYINFTSINLPIFLRHNALKT